MSSIQRSRTPDSITSWPGSLVRHLSNTDTRRWGKEGHEGKEKAHPGPFFKYKARQNGDRVVRGQAFLISSLKGPAGEPLAPNTIRPLYRSHRLCLLPPFAFHSLGWGTFFCYLAFRGLRRLIWGEHRAVTRLRWREDHGLQRKMKSLETILRSMGRLLATGLLCPRKQVFPCTPRPISLPFFFFFFFRLIRFLFIARGHGHEVFVIFLLK